MVFSHFTYLSQLLPLPLYLPPPPALLHSLLKEGKVSHGESSTKSIQTFSLIKELFANKEHKGKSLSFPTICNSNRRCSPPSGCLNGVEMLAELPLESISGTSQQGKHRKCKHWDQKKGKQRFLQQRILSEVKGQTMCWCWWGSSL